MSFDLGVWYSDKPLTDEEVADLYVKLCEQAWIPIEENPAVDAFYAELTSRYPEIDTVPEEELENCPWSCAHDRSGLHALMAMRWSRCAEIAPIVVDLAAEHGLVCFNPQESKVHLPPKLELKPSRFRSWWNQIQMLLGGTGILALAVVLGFAQEFDPRDPAIIAGRLNRADGVVVGKFGVDSCLPWFDGWHCSGAIHIGESLYGDWKVKDSVRFRWKEGYGVSCLICEKVSQFDGHEGIWFLTHKNAAWQLTGNGSSWFGGPLPINDHDAVVRQIRDRHTR